MQKDTILSFLNNLRDPASLKVREKAEEASRYETGILIYGETGTGKDFWAEYIRHLSGREKMINLNCGDVPENLLESEWFGYRKGSFTGAGNDYEGRWGSVGHGIIFLNRIDLLSINMQARLLRIIESKKYYALGSADEKKINARFIFSADHDITEKTERGEFRKDLYYRISGCSIFLPPIRDRKQDILPLIRFFAEQKGLKLDITGKGEKKLNGYNWDGNIREIENFVNNISITRRSITDEDTDSIAGYPDRRPYGFSEDISLKEMEKRYIEYMIKKHGNKTKVSEILQISRKSLYDRLKKNDGD